MRISGLPRSSYYYHRQRLQENKYSELVQAIRTLFAQHKGRYGYRRITCALRQSGYAVNHKTVLKLMRREGLKCQVRRVRYRSYKGPVGRIAPNLLQRKFAATAPNQKWATDVTEFAVDGQKLYLSPIIDLYNGEVGAASQIRDDNPDARKGVSKDQRQHRITATLRSGMAIPDGALSQTLGKERNPTKHVTKGELSGQCNGRKLLFNTKVRDVLHAEVYIYRTTRGENTSIY